MTTVLFHISDVHFGAEDRDALAIVEKAIAQERPDALVCTGDVTQRASRRQYRDAARWFGALGVPVWLDPGNHDMPYGNLAERFTDPYRRFEELREAVAVAHFETQDVVLVPLKTTVRAQARWPWSDGHVTRSAQAKAIDLLARYEGDARHVIVTAHHPLHGPEPGGPSSTVQGNNALALLAQKGMDAILSGHVHRAFDEHRRGADWEARVIGAGTLSTRVRHGEPAGFNVIRCTLGEPLEVERRRFAAMSA